MVFYMAEFDFSKVRRTDYSVIDTFERIGYTYTKIAENAEYVCWEMTKEGLHLYSVEVWKKRFGKNPDGTIYLKPPSDENFGKYGWYFSGKKEQVRQRVLDRFGICLF